MNKMRICVDDQTLEMNDFHRISSNICVQIDNFSFPSENWFDITGSVISIWLISTNKHLLRYEETTELFFMDGDFSIRLVRQNARCSTAYFLDSNNVCIQKSAIDIQYWSRQLLAVSAKIINHFPQYSSEPSIIELKRQSSILKSTLHRLRSEVSYDM